MQKFFIVLEFSSTAKILPPQIITARHCVPAMSVPWLSHANQRFSQQQLPICRCKRGIHTHIHVAFFWTQQPSFKVAKFLWRPVFMGGFNHENLTPWKFNPQNISPVKISAYTVQVTYKLQYSLSKTIKQKGIVVSLKPSKNLQFTLNGPVLYMFSLQICSDSEYRS